MSCSGPGFSQVFNSVFSREYMGNDEDHVKRYEEAGMVRIDGIWYHKDHIKEHGLQETKAIYAEIERLGREMERTPSWLIFAEVSSDKSSDKSKDKASYKE